MTRLYAIAAPLAGALSLAYGVCGDYPTAIWYAALSGVAALGAMLRSGQ